MQQAQSDECHNIKLSADGKIIGLLAKDNSADNCDDTQWYDEVKNSPLFGKGEGTTSIYIPSDVSVTISTSDFSFDQMGRPVGCGICEISVIGGEATLKVKIESEGYIHAL